MSLRWLFATIIQPSAGPPCPKPPPAGGGLKRRIPVLVETMASVAKWSKGACLWHRRSRVRIPSLAPSLIPPAKLAPVAQWTEHWASGPRGCRFDSCRARHKSHLKSPRSKAGSPYFGLVRPIGVELPFPGSDGGVEWLGSMACSGIQPCSRPVSASFKIYAGWHLKYPLCAWATISQLIYQALVSLQGFHITLNDAAIPNYALFNSSPPPSSRR